MVIDMVIDIAIYKRKRCSTQDLRGAMQTTLQLRQDLLAGAIKKERYAA